jgi:L-alanine-DL-glutamate epimerase-like enolase superfamily enzyme
MGRISLSIAHERWPLKVPFRFTGFRVDVLDTVCVTLEREGIAGRGEGVPPVVFGVTPETVIAGIENVRRDIEAGIDRQALQTLMPRGAARNAVDCALWDLDAKASGRTVWELAGIDPVRSLEIDLSLGLDSPAAMADAARTASKAWRVLKIKLDGEQIVERIAAIRAATPETSLLVDANMAWDISTLRAVAGDLAGLGVAMIEQPLPAEADAELAGFVSPVPIFADESCHDRTDLDAVAGRYSGINIKLDKAGGLTESLALAREAEQNGLGLMVGCMAGTSLSMAPGFVIGALSQWRDLDGPLLLRDDRAPGMVYRDGSLQAFEPVLWG